MKPQLTARQLRPARMIAALLILEDPTPPLPVARAIPSRSLFLPLVVR